jgi:predicted nuclease of predicted toxin-antitoxin system
MRLLFDESLSPRLVELLRDLFTESESASKRAGGDLRILEYASAGNFILVSTDGDFEGLLSRIPGANVIILRSCSYQPRSPPRYSGATRSVSLSCPVPRIA